MQSLASHWGSSNSAAVCDFDKVVSEITHDKANTHVQMPTKQQKASEVQHRQLLRSVVSCVLWLGLSASAPDTPAHMYRVHHHGSDYSLMVPVCDLKL